MKKIEDNITGILIATNVIIIALFMMFKPSHWDISIAIWCGLGFIFIIHTIALLAYSLYTLNKLRQQRDFFKQKSNEHPLREWEQQDKWLITKSENKFKKHLRQYLPKDLEIHCNVRLVDVLAPNHREHLYANQQKYSGIIMMHIDYTIIETESAKIVMVIELDDSTHNDSKRKDRDKKKDITLQKSNIHCKRVKLEEAYDKDIMKSIIEFCKNQTGNF